MPVFQQFFTSHFGHFLLSQPRLQRRQRGQFSGRIRPRYSTCPRRPLSFQRDRQVIGAA